MGDTFDAGVIITLSGGASGAPVSANLTIEGGEEAVLAAAGETQRSVVTDGDGRVEVRFKFEALALGQGAFRITAGEALDPFERICPWPIPLITRLSQHDEAAPFTRPAISVKLVGLWHGIGFVRRKDCGL